MEKVSGNAAHSTTLDIFGQPEYKAIPQFVQGLKQHVRNVLIINDDMETLSVVIVEGTRVDARMFTERTRHGSGRGKQQQQQRQGQSGTRRPIAR